MAEGGGGALAARVGGGKAGRAGTARHCPVHNHIWPSYMASRQPHATILQPYAGTAGCGGAARQQQSGAPRLRRTFTLTPTPNPNPSPSPNPNPSPNPKHLMRIPAQVGAAPNLAWEASEPI